MLEANAKASFLNEIVDGLESSDVTDSDVVKDLVRCSLLYVVKDLVRCSSIYTISMYVKDLVRCSLFSCVCVCVSRILSGAHCFFCFVCGLGGEDIAYILHSILHSIHTTLHTYYIAYILHYPQTYT